ncbi:hypothetical protein [Streptomyces chattanoogensis]|uniref:hypothetical protein n=1 Tax=Streptomyces chattanoogensis TaxID=66876 RepID=UPI0036972715
MTYNPDRDHQLNPFRYKPDGMLADASKEQNVDMSPNSAGGAAPALPAAAGRHPSVHIATHTKAENALEASVSLGSPK